MEEATTEAVVEQASSSGDVAIFLSLMVLIAAISLYEYFSSIGWQQVTSSTRNNVVFENRNKEYGAYELRSNYNKNLLLIILGLVISILLIYGGKMAYDKYAASNYVEEEDDLQSVVIDYYEDLDDEEDDIIEEEEEIIEEELQLEDQTAFLPPVVTNEEVDTPPPTVTELDNTKVGTQTVEGNVEYSTEAPPPPPPPVVEKKEPVIETVVDELAEFPGGRKALVKYLVENMKYPDIARELGLSGRSVLKFVVDTQGNISSVTVVRKMKDCKECDAEAVRVIRRMPKWVPAKKGGKTVPSYFILPVEFSLE